MTSKSSIWRPPEPKNSPRRKFKIRCGKNQVAVDQDADEVDEPKPIWPEEEREKPTELALLFSRSSSSENDTLLEEKESVPEDVRSLSPLTYGAVSVIGRRREMEDAVRVELGFMSLQSEPLDFFAVYDGHGGPQVAEGCWERLHKVFEEVMKEGEEEGGDKNGGGVDWEKVMVGCFGKMDGEFVGEDVSEEVNTVGTTAVVAVVSKEVVVVANCGDSRAVLSKGGVALALSVDHKPDRPDELSRVEAAGGRVINWDGLRVMGVLATSRSIGDKYLKPFVISEPEVVVSNRTDDDEFLILASDGLWDVVSNDFACKVVRKCLDGRMRRKSQDVVHLVNFASEAAAVLAELAMARGSRDNISVVVVELNKSRNSQL